MVESNHGVMATTLSAGWARSSWCTPNGNCLEVQHDAETVRVRDSKNTGAGRLAFDRRQWTEFVTIVT